MSLERLMVGTEAVSRSFYARPTVEVARGLIGKVIVHPPAAGRIVEVEAYLGLEDGAAHASRGLTERTRVLFGPPGHAYVYLVYGMHECLNFVAEPDGSPGCVLIRALEPITGLETMRARRPNARRREDLASGPGKLTRAMDITRRHYGCDLIEGSLTVRAFRNEPAADVDASPRIGIRHCADWLLRFTLAGSRYVSDSPARAG